MTIALIVERSLVGVIVFTIFGLKYSFGFAIKYSYLSFVVEEITNFAIRKLNVMNTRHLAVFCIILFVQAISYPLVVFAVYVQGHNSETPRSLPDNFPDNGSSCFFGLNNNEEENENYNGNLFFELNKQFSPSLWRDISLQQGHHRMVYLENTHPEITTPPPEFV